MGPEPTSTLKEDFGSPGRVRIARQDPIGKVGFMQNLPDLYQAVILDHNRNPRNHRVLEGATAVARGENPSCGDQYEVSLKLEAGQIREICFQGSGCAISRASASILTTELEGQSIENATQKIRAFNTLIETGEAADSVSVSMAAFTGIHKFPARRKCAKLAWGAAMKALKGKSESSGS